MKKYCIAAYAIASTILFLSQPILADDACIVIGFHEPNSQTYDGPTYCSSVTIKNIIVRGPLHTDHAVMLGTTQVDGPLFSKSTLFNTIQIKSPFSQMKVRLQDHTIDKHNLIFEGASGLYHVDHSSNIEGKVINGNPMNKAPV